jgi:ATP-dependent helicase HrpA
MRPRNSSEDRGGQPREPAVLAFLAELRDEIARLVPPDFLIRYDAERLAHVGRYLRALAVRAERGAVHLEKDQEKAGEIRPLAEWHDQALGELTPNASPEKRRALEELRWMIEEYKVSVFAQELKTAFPVSRKKIDALMGEIQRML